MVICEHLIKNYLNISSSTTKRRLPLCYQYTLDWGAYCQTRFKVMARWFNISGPCEPSKHYMLPPTVRLPNLSRLIQQESYFVIHAPRQTGKTTAMLALAQELTESGQYCAATLSVEVGNAFEHDLGGAELAILATWRGKIEDRLPSNLQPPTWIEGPPGQRIRANLRSWAKASKLPLVLFIDEIDSLKNEILISVL
jgi:DNA polymerase III delta prime subunit